MKNSYTHIVEKSADVDIWNCNDCGAYADEIKNIKHHSTCKPGEAKRWENIYSKEEE